MKNVPLLAILAGFTLAACAQTFEADAWWSAASIDESVENKVSVAGWHTRILHLIGMDYRRLVFDDIVVEAILA